MAVLKGLSIIIPSAIGMGCTTYVILGAIVKRMDRKKQELINLIDYRIKMSKYD